MNWSQIFVMIPVIIAIITGYEYVRVRLVNVSFLHRIMQSEIDKDILKGKIVDLEQEKLMLSSEEFLSFINTSRDQAYTYIEMAQEAIKEYDDVVGKIVKYYDTYGQAVRTDPYSGDLEQISIAHKILMSKLMPEGEDDASA